MFFELVDGSVTCVGAVLVYGLAVLQLYDAVE